MTDAGRAENQGSIGVLFWPFAIALIYGVFAMGMPVSQALIPDRQHRDLFLLAIGALGLAGAFRNFRPALRTREDRWIAAFALALPGYALLQVLPLPVWLIGIVSPERARLVGALTPVTGPHTFASLSIVPAATFTHFLLWTAYGVIFFAAWELTLRAREKVWILAGPVLLAAALEAILGFLQLFSGSHNTVVHGTYAIRNHFAALLELALPLAAMYTLAALRQAPPRGYMDAAAGGRLAGGAALTALFATAILSSLSRGGVAAMLASALVTAAVATNWKMPIRRKFAASCVFCLLAALSVFYLTPMSLVARLSQHNTAGRLSVWSEAAGIIGQYPLLGCGLGGFESAFLRFKTVERLLLVDYAHNDYLQLLVEAGAAGFLLGLTFFCLLARRATRISDDSSDIRWVGLACVGSLTAIAVHSAFDFNLYVPANAAVLAWICGMAAGLRPAGSFVAPALAATGLRADPVMESG